MRQTGLIVGIGEGKPVAWRREAKPEPSPSPPANWYPDPDNATRWRYWDGATWTQHFAPRTASTLLQPHAGLPAVVTTEALVPRQQSAASVPSSGVPSLADLVSQARLEAPRLPLDEQVEVAGETYYVKAIKKVFREHKMPIQEGGSTLENVQCILAPEPWNPHDPNAVAVMIGIHQVGHLPAELARDYAHPLARLAASRVLATGVARLWAKTDSGVVRARVTVMLPEVEQFTR